MTEAATFEQVSQTSQAPDGSRFDIPPLARLRVAFRTIERAAAMHRSRGAKVVVVQGLGFVGAAVAATVADVRTRSGDPAYFVIGVDLATLQSYWKIAKLNQGIAPIDSADPDVARITHDAVRRGNLRATSLEAAYAIADVIVVDVHLDVRNRFVEYADEIEVATDGLSAAITAIGRHMRADALVLIETTVPVGACERWIEPILTRERTARGIASPVLLAHAYERVTPGARYVASIRDSPRTFAGSTPEAAERARTFLASLGGGGEERLWQLGSTTSSELAKLLENSYRAANIAFIHEWALLAEEIGVNLFEIVDSIRVRQGTHDNMRYPGLGVGGYCLTKDSLLAQWGATQLIGGTTVLESTLAALRTNFVMPLHTLEHVRELAGGDLRDTTVAVCGVAYIPDVADTRNSPAELLVDTLVERGASVRIHDPRVRTWLERPHQPVLGDLDAVLQGADGVVFAVPHPEYAAVPAETIADALEGKRFVVDAQNVISDELAASLHREGCRVVGVGKGHWNRLGYSDAA